MNNPNVHIILDDLENKYCQICSEVDNFVGDILQWANELAAVVEQKFSEGNEASIFQLPKTPREKRTRNKKPRNGLDSKCSVLNSTIDYNEVISLDDTVSTRTRAARRAATSKISQFNITKEIETNNKTKLMDKTNNGDASDATFVVPQATVRTKPVLKNKQGAEPPEFKSPVSRKTENKIQRSNQGSSSEKEPVRKKTSRTLSGSPPERQSRRKISKTMSSSQTEQEQVEVAPVTVNETPVERPSRRKVSRALSGSPVERVSKSKIHRTFSGSPVVRSSKLVVPRSPSNSPITRSSSLRSSRALKSPIVRSSGDNMTSQERKSSKVGTNNSINRTITIKKEATPSTASTFMIPSDEYEANDSIINESKTPRVTGGRFTRISKTSTPVTDGEKTPLVKGEEFSPDEIGEGIGGNVEADMISDSHIDATYSVEVANETEEESEDVPVPKKKRKLKKEEETLKENIEEMANGGRITRTKSRAIKKMMEENETKQSDLSAFAKKLLNRAKMTSLKKSQLGALLECNSSTPTNGPPQTIVLPLMNLTSKSKYHLLMSGSKKLKTPLATLPNSSVKIAKPSGDKDRPKVNRAKRDSSLENLVRSITKPQKDDAIEREIKLKSKKEKEEEAALKRQNVIKNKQEELRRKNELKHQMAMKQREKLEQEKYNNMIQSEKEKEERHKLILQERQMKLKEEARKKKILTQQKIAETVERRRVEEEARIAKLKEMEAEEQRLALEKQKEQERQERRAQERLAEKKAREEYEMKLKQELEAERIKTEKMSTAKNCKYLQSASKMQSASKRQKFPLIGEKREWDYKSRNENDYGLEDEHSEVDSEDERECNKSRPPVPWGKKIMNGKSPLVKIITLEMLSEYMTVYQKSPDIHKMFKMTPSKRIKRTSSAIWNTPSS